MTISRRELLGALPAVALLPRALTAQGPRQLRVRGLHSMTLAVSDVKRSLEFYQGLFGMPIQARHGDTPLLRVGPGPKFMALTPAGADGAMGVSRFGIAVEDFNADRIVAVLGEPRRGPRGRLEPVGGRAAESARHDARQDARDLRVRSERRRLPAAGPHATAAAADRSAARVERCSRLLPKG